MDEDIDDLMISVTIVHYQLSLINCSVYYLYYK